MDHSSSAPRWNQCLAAAAAAVILTISWQAATVHFNYQGQWSALFFIGSQWPLPPELSCNAHFHPDNAGYDGGFYHLVAHDPWLARGFSRFADNARLRWRRILAPALAHFLAGGSDSRVHSAYIVVNLLFVFCGTFWLARYFALHDLSPAYGMIFLAIPSVLVSMDRLTIDTALAAFTIGFVFHASANQTATKALILILSPLARETGLALTAGQAWLYGRDRQWKHCILTLLSTLPFAAWALFVFFHTSSDVTQWLSIPFAGILRRTFHPIQYAITGKWVALAAVLDYLALVGVWIAVAFAIREAFRRSPDLIAFCALSFTLGMLCLGKADIWTGAYEFGRTMSPLMVLLGLKAIHERRGRFAIPLACTLPRILLQLEPQVRGILKG